MLELRPIAVILSTLSAALVSGCNSGADTTTSTTVAAGSGSGTASTGASQTTGAGGGGSSGPMPTYMPTAMGPCPDMSNLNGTAVTFAGQPATVWSGDPAKGPGPLLIYYYATGSSPLEPAVTMGEPQIAAITAMGGAVVAQNKTTAQGTTTGNNVWYTGDAAIADEIVACSVQTQHTDPRRVHVAGYSAGALQTTYMWFARSGYVASVLTYSGGDVDIDVVPIQDAAHPPPALVTHGAMGMDTYGGVVDFFVASTKWEGDIKAANGFAIDCNDGGTHTNFQLRTKVAPQALQFFLDHPYGVTPEPYTTLPAGFPAYCSIK
jgi:hypothetical protein